MKAKSKAKAKTRSRSKTRAKPKKSRTTRTTATPRPASITTPPLSPDFKTCEEVEVGDIGGDGDPGGGRLEKGTPETQLTRPTCQTDVRKFYCNPDRRHHREV